jgi:predicted RNase H-like nuclease
VVVRPVLGVDACPAGWVGVTLAGPCVRAVVHAEIGGLIALAAVARPLAAIAIDIPIGLADCGTRQADLLARTAAGRRWASVFVTPVRTAVQADTYAEALAVSRALASRARRSGCGTRSCRSTAGEGGRHARSSRRTPN